MPAANQTRISIGWHPGHAIGISGETAAEIGVPLVEITGGLAYLRRLSPQKADEIAAALMRAACAARGEVVATLPEVPAGTREIEAAAAAIANARAARRGAPSIENVLEVLQRIAGGKLYGEVMEDARAALAAAAAARQNGGEHALRTD